jgi:hypothetical protein
MYPVPNTVFAHAFFKFLFSPIISVFSVIYTVFAVHHIIKVHKMDLKTPGFVEELVPDLTHLELVADLVH